MPLVNEFTAMESIKIGILQLDIAWQDIEANQNKIETRLAALPDIPHIIILPETFTTGFTTTPHQLRKSLLSAQIDWQIQLSFKHNCSFMGSVIVFDEDVYSNRCLYTSPDGKVEFYNKRHLFTNEKECGFFEQGTERKTFNYRDLKLMPLICYDLRFPVWSRNNLGYDVLVYMANWPSARQIVWETLLRARAIENQCIVVGVNRVGTDHNGITYEGGSAIIFPDGSNLLSLGSSETYAEQEVSLSNLYDFRRRYPFYLDADLFEIKNPGN